MKTITLCALLIASGLALAAEEPMDLEALRAEQMNLLEQINPKALELSNSQRQIQPPPGSMEKTSDMDIEALVERFERVQRGESVDETKRKAGLYAFVSLSVPQAVLRTIARDVKRGGGTMVLRGFKENANMATTVAALKSVNEGIGVEWSIDPDLFSALKIEKVPAIAIMMEKPGVSICGVETQSQGGCSDTFDAAVAYGDISVPHAMRRILAGSQQPLIRSQARDVLAKVESKPQ